MLSSGGWCQNGVKLQSTQLVSSFPGSLAVKKTLTADAGTAGLISGSGRSPGGRNGNPCQYSCLGNPWTEELGGLQSMESQRVGHV